MLSQPKGHFYFDGSFFGGPANACQAAISNGATASVATLMRRIKRGATTFAELMEPPKNAGAKKGYKDRAHAEMHAICMELDARKKAMGLDK